MAQKKSAGKKVAAKKVSKKVAKKTAKKAAKVAKKAASKRASKGKGKGKVTDEAIAAEAFYIYRERQENGLPGDPDGDWLEAKRRLKA